MVIIYNIIYNFISNFFFIYFKTVTSKCSTLVARLFCAIDLGIECAFLHLTKLTFEKKITVIKEEMYVDKYLLFLQVCYKIDIKLKIKNNYKKPVPL